MDLARHFAGDDGRRLNAGGYTVSVLSSSVIFIPACGQLDAHADAGKARRTMSTSTEVSALVRNCRRAQAC
jgi:hypothetical protein